MIRYLWFFLKPDDPVYVAPGGDSAKSLPDRLVRMRPVAAYAQAAVRVCLFVHLLLPRLRRIPARPDPLVRATGIANRYIKRKGRCVMAESIYKVIDLIGTSPTSWEEAARQAVETAGKNIRDLRVAEVIKLDMKVENGKVTAFRARVNISFKYEGQN